MAAYSDTMANDFGGDVRAIMATPQYRLVFPTHRLRRGGNAKDNLETVQGGRLVFVGRGGALTGRGAHILLVDDLYKDHEEARSQAIRDRAWNWFTRATGAGAGCPSGISAAEGGGTIEASPRRGFFLSR